jgi:ATP phosphoribosyltransferase
MNSPSAKLSALLKILPALRTPTVSALADKKWVAVETVIDEKLVRRIIPELKEAGAEGIIEFPLNKLIQ